MASSLSFLCLVSVSSSEIRCGWSLPSFLTCASCLHSIVLQDPGQLYHFDFHILKLIIKIEWAVSGGSTEFLRETIASPGISPLLQESNRWLSGRSTPVPGHQPACRHCSTCRGNWMRLRMRNCLVRSKAGGTSSGSLILVLSPAL